MAVGLPQGGRELLRGREGTDPPPPETGVLCGLARGSPLGLAPTCLLSTRRTEASPRTTEGREGN